MTYEAQAGSGMLRGATAKNMFLLAPRVGKGKLPIEVMLPLVLFRDLGQMLPGLIHLWSCSVLE